MPQLFKTLSSLNNDLQKVQSHRVMQDDFPITWQPQPIEAIWLSCLHTPIKPQHT